jgi:hypothetical protein
MYLIFYFYLLITLDSLIFVLLNISIARRIQSFSVQFVAARAAAAADRHVKCVE